MKLIARYNQVNIPITVTILLISSIGYYFILHYALVYQLDKDLRVEQQEIIQHVKETGTLPETSDYKDQQVEFQPTSMDEFKDHFYTETVYSKKEGEEESYRRIDFFISRDGHHFIATVKKSQQETEDVVQLILTITLSVIVILLLIIYISNRFLLSKLWRPFNHTLEQLKQFSFFSKNKIVLQKTGIDEFKELNETALLMTEKVTRDFETLKSFTENASHEIQTPLAIIKNKIELLSQSENLDGSQVSLILGISDAASRLSRLNQSLLLLAKIENNQFGNIMKIDFSCLVNRYVDHFEELAIAKNIKIRKNIAAKVFTEMNESLAEVLISNIIINAIKHNYPNGHIQIDLDTYSFEVRNSGDRPASDTSELFGRFKKDSSSPDSLGLGLSIVKTICGIYNFSVSYHYRLATHVICVAWPQKG